MRQYFLIPLLILFFLSKSNATELALDLQRSGQTKSQGLSASGEFGGKIEASDEDEKAEDEKVEDTELPQPTTVFDWNGSYSRSTSSVTATSGNAITYTTQDFGGGIGFSSPSGVYGAVDLAYSTTPEEELSNLGPTVSIGYGYKFGVAGQEEYRPKVSFSLSVGQQNYEQKFTVQRRRSNGTTHPVSGTENISQKTVGGTLSLGPWRWLKLKLGYEKYSYDKDVNQFLQYIDARKLLSAQTTGLNQAVFGFYNQKTTLEFDFFIAEQWEIDLVHSLIRLQADGSGYTSDEVRVSYDITESWRIALGAEISRADSSASSASNSNVTTGILNVAYTF